MAEAVVLTYTGAAVAFPVETVVVFAQSVAGTDELFLNIADVVMFVWKTETVVFLETATVEELVMAKVGLVAAAVIVVLTWPVTLVIFASLLELMAPKSCILEVVEGACHVFDHGFDHGLYHGCVVKELVFKELVELLARPTLRDDTLDEVVFGKVVSEIVELALMDVGLVATTVELVLEKLLTELVLAEVAFAELELREEENAAVDALVELCKLTVFDDVVIVLAKDSLELENGFTTLEDDSRVLEDDLIVLEDETEELDETDELEVKVEILGAV